MKVTDFPDSVRGAFGAASRDVLQQRVGDDIDTQCHDMSSLRRSAARASVCEGAFARQRNRVVGI